MRQIIFLWFALILMTLRPVLANDGFGQLGVGGVIIGKTDKIALLREVLDISHSQIRVNYDFINEGNQDITQTIIFPLPPYPARPNESGVIYHGQPLGFEVVINGKSLPFNIRVRAEHQGLDVTDQLKRAGLSERQIARLPFDSTLINDENRFSGTQDQQQSLTNAGLLNDEGQPDWEIFVTYEWLYTFPAHKTIHVSHQYRPFIAEGTAGDYSFFNETERVGDKIPADFCFEPESLAKLRHLASNPKNLNVYNEISGTIVNYILTTANTWKDGIRDFTLRIHKSSSEIVSLCFPGKFKVIDSKTLSVHKKNFRPSSDLIIYYGNLAIPAGADNNTIDSYGLPPVPESR